MTIPSSSEIRLRILTIKHHTRKKFFEFLENPNAPIYVKVIGVVVAFLLLVTILHILSWLWSVASYRSDPIAYIKEYYNPETPRYLDTSTYRSSDDNIFDLEAYKEELFLLNEYNTYLSDRLPINRIHKDPRSEKCRNKAKKLPPNSELHTASVIIVMYNEELSVILRTIVSILLNTPMETVKEVIIIDDKSDKDELGDRLDKELTAFPFVKLIRNSKREGLIRSRIIGSKAAEGSILLFLDSHVEMGQGWIQPLLARVMEDPKTVVCPTIATIHHTTLDLTPAKYSNIWGIWDWDMNFRWTTISPREAQRRAFDDSNPIRTPAMAGGLYAMQKEYFFELGAYDPGMKIWGAENLEMSFRIWMCGGAIEINTCSIVGHIFRRAGVIQKTLPGEQAMKQNVKRAVDVWLDEYKETHYVAVPGSRRVEGGDIVSRVLLRQRLKCQSFSWYLNEVFPEQHRPEKDFVAYGQLKGPSKVCMDTMGPGVGHQVGAYLCHGEGSNQFWKLMLSGEMTNGGLCLDGDGNNPRNIVMYECHGLKGNQQWFITEAGIVRHGGSGKCLSHDGTYLMLLPCDSETDESRLIWEFGAVTEELLARFYEIHATQFRYKTNASIEKEQNERSKRKAELKSAQKQRAEEKKQREALSQGEQKEDSLDKLSGDNVYVEKTAKISKEEQEFQLWKAEKKRKKEEEEEENRRHREEGIEKQKEEDKMREEDERKKLIEKQRLLEEKNREKVEFEKEQLENNFKKEQLDINLNNDQVENNLSENADQDNSKTNEDGVANSKQTIEKENSKKDEFKLSSAEQEKINNLERQAAEKEQKEKAEINIEPTKKLENKVAHNADRANDSKEDNINDKSSHEKKGSSNLEPNADIHLDNKQLQEFLAWKAAQEV